MSVEMDVESEPFILLLNLAGSTAQTIKFFELVTFIGPYEQTNKF